VTTSQPVRYDENIARAYLAMLSDTVADPGNAALLDLLGDASEPRVLDLPCGEGRVARELARRGAEVIAADVSAAMLARARAFEPAEPLGITYVEASGTDAGWPATEAPPTDPRHTVGTIHRMFGSYFNAFARWGFELEQVAEPEPAPEWRLPEAEPVPVFLVARYRRLA
jgi:SAM-dependent methyltransferase